MTCQWLCQRTMLVTPGAIDWLSTSPCSVVTNGRMTRTRTINPKIRPEASENTCSLGVEVSTSTSRPINTGIAASAMATSKLASRSAMNSPVAWRTKNQ